VSTLLSSKETAFVLITSPDAEVLQETEKFRLGLERMTIPLRGVVVNRMHQQRPYDMEKRLDRKSLTRRIRKKFSAPDTELDLQWMVENFLTHQERTKSEEKRIQKFCENLLPTIPIVQVPLLRESLVDLGGLTSLLHYLFPRENNGII
jgi:anion-transporting  ArsA/GET3 family ATPase